MKKVATVLAAMMLCSLLTAPALVARAEDGEFTEAAESEVQVEVDLPDMVMIEDEDVPLSALPMSFLDETGGTASPHAFTTAGIILMGLSAFGMALITFRRESERGKERV